MKKDYSYKTYHNTLYNRRKKNIGMAKKLRFIGIAIIIVMLFFLFSDLLTIKNIQISGHQTLEEESLRLSVEEFFKKKSFILFRQSNSIMLNKKKVGEMLKKKYSLREVMVKKIYPKTLRITIEENTPYIILIHNELSYFIDKNGNIISPILSKQEKKEDFKDYNILRHNILNQNLPIFYNTSKKNILQNNSLNQNLLNIINILLQQLKNYQSIHTNYFEINIDEIRISVITNEGWKIHFSLDDPADKQIQRLSVILNNQEKVGKIIDYIDLRYGDRIFYR